MANQKAPLFSTCLEKQTAVIALFAACQTAEEKYLKIIALGKEAAPFPEEEKKEENKVRGCQSTVYLHCSSVNGLLYFAIESDALISAGLAALLLAVYNGEDAETILKCPPSFIEELNLNASLSPSRANGLYSIHLRMKQEALKNLLAQNQRQ